MGHRDGSVQFGNIVSPEGAQRLSGGQSHRQGIGIAALDARLRGRDDEGFSRPLPFSEGVENTVGIRKCLSVLCGKFFHATVGESKQGHDIAIRTRC